MLYLKSGLEKGCVGGCAGGLCRWFLRPPGVVQGGCAGSWGGRRPDSMLEQKLAFSFGKQYILFKVVHFAFKPSSFIPKQAHTCLFGNDM